MTPGQNAMFQVSDCDQFSIEIWVAKKPLS